MNHSRRKFLKHGLAAGMATTGAAIASTQITNALHPTPNGTEGPFYPVVAQKDKDFDLTQIEGRNESARGKHIFIEGVVLDTDGNPVEDATVDLWQANAVGRYRHPHDESNTPLDENFQGWAIVPSGKKGEFRLKTVFPGAYPAGGNWSRPPHIHFKITKRGYVELITQMYFPGEKLNDTDRLLQRHGKKEQQQMIAKNVAGRPDTFRYQIVLQKA